MKKEEEKNGKKKKRRKRKEKTHEKTTTTKQAKTKTNLKHRNKSTTLLFGDCVLTTLNQHVLKFRPILWKR